MAIRITRDTALAERLARGLPLSVLGQLPLPSPLSRLLVSTWAAPMAYTYEDHYELRIERPGEQATMRTGQALSEFSYANKPSNLTVF